MRAGQNVLPMPFSRAARRLPAALWRGLKAVLTVVGVVGIWTSFAADLVAKTSDEGQPPSLIGSYLSGRFARAQQEPEQAAAFYKSALDQDAADPVLLEHTFQMETAAGRFDRAIPLAEQLIAKQPDNRMARTVLALTAFKAKDYIRAEEHMKAASDGPIGELTSAIGRAWIKQAAGDTQGALEIIDAPK